MTRLIMELENLDSHIGSMVYSWQSADLTDRESVLYFISSVRLIFVLANNLLEEHEAVMSETDVTRVCELANIVLEIQDIMFEQLKLIRPSN